jgi:hypothetical protein
VLLNPVAAVAEPVRLADWTTNKRRRVVPIETYKAKAFSSTRMAVTSDRKFRNKPLWSPRMRSPASIATVEFIDENGSGPGVRLRTGRK